MSERFYINCPLAAGKTVLEGEEAHHLAAVCRLQPGDPLFLFNGDGLEYPARVDAVKRGQVVLEVLPPTRPDRELSFTLTVACPLPKGDRAQFLVEKLTELGIAVYVPLSSQRRTLQPREVRSDRLRRHVIEASKQCGRNVLLQVEAAQSWDRYCRRGNLPALRVLAHPGSSRSLSELVPAMAASPMVAVAVGPEGGFTSEEVERARAAGWTPVDLGPRILRVETAAVFLAAAVIVSKGR
jgi:16S rRNA (uracil1498-N3)-methyltransferase